MLRERPSERDKRISHLVMGLIVVIAVAGALFFLLPLLLFFLLGVSGAEWG